MLCLRLLPPVQLCACMCRLLALSICNTMLAGIHKFKYRLSTLSHFVCFPRGKAPTLPLPPLPDLQNTKTNLKAINLSTDKEQQIWGMRTNLVLPALAATLLVGLVMLAASAIMQPE